jgi:VWFA-related protein
VLRATLALAPLVITDTVDVMSVPVETTVVDAAGRFISDLATADFELLEDGHPEALDAVTALRQPALFTLLVDSSQSMATQVAAVRRAASRLLAPLRPEDAVIVAPFARGVLSVTGPTLDRQTALDAIAAIRPSGGTAILDALREVAGTLQHAEGRRAVVLITDGYDEHSELDVESALEALRERGITLYVIGVGGVAGISLKGEALLTRLATTTGGRAWFPRDERRLAEAYEALAGEVQQRYLLTYTPSNQRRDGSWRDIVVRVRRPGLHVRARPGYTAPVPAPIRTSIEFTAVGRGDAQVALSAEGISVLEDGVEQVVDTFQEAVLPVSIMLALDSSGSMKGSAARAQQAAREFILSARPEDGIGLITFADTSDVHHAPMLPRETPLTAVDAYTARGGTALYDALHDALTQLAAVRDARRAVVVVTDGRDENATSDGPGSLRTWDEVLALQQKTDAAVYAVGLGSRVDRARLQELADRSGGAAYFPAGSESLSAQFASIIDEMRRRYVVGWESSNRERSGQWRKVDIFVGPGVTVRSRGGYFAPAE